MLKCMFDTVIFNRVLDGIVPIERLVGLVTPFATHSVLAETVTMIQIIAPSSAATLHCRPSCQSPFAPCPRERKSE
jgi:hypothetical protein